MTPLRSFPQKYAVALLLAAACGELGEYDEDIESPPDDTARPSDENGQDTVNDFGEADSEELAVYEGTEVLSTSAGAHDSGYQQGEAGIGLISSALTVSERTFSSTAGTEMTEPAAGIIVVSSGDEPKWWERRQERLQLLSRFLCDPV